MEEKFQTLLREKGRSITKSRLLLFNYLQKSGPVSPKRFMEDNAAIADRASLYRALLLFKQLGVVEERITAGRRLIELTDNYDSHHHHLTCTNCGMSIAVTAPAIEVALTRLGDEHGFKVERHIIEVDGLCAVCQKTA